MSQRFVFFVCFFKSDISCIETVKQKTQLVAGSQLSSIRKR